MANFRHWLMRKYATPGTAGLHSSLMDLLHLDKPLLLSLMILSLLGLVVLYSAESQNIKMVFHQFIRLILAFMLMVGVAQIPPQRLRIWTPWAYLLGMILLVAVMAVGHIGKGAQRWLDLGFIRFQPSEILKLVIPMAVAWFLYRQALPPSFKTFVIALGIIILPAILTALQPDLGTAVILICAGGSVLLLAGLSRKIILGTLSLILGALPVLWIFLHDYQRQRILTFLDPERDPLGAGYHIIQSKIAIGSGGFWGKGWLNGSQAHLNYLPEHATDFIFAVVGEEFGFVGSLVLILLFGFIIGRCLYISMMAKDNFCRWLAGSICVTFFLSVFINAGMVAGILPVVGLPLPLVSYGGTALVINMLNFGILMSIHTHKRLLGN